MLKQKPVLWIVYRMIGPWTSSGLGRLITQFVLGFMSQTMVPFYYNWVTALLRRGSKKNERLWVSQFMSGKWTHLRSNLSESSGH